VICSRLVSLREIDVEMVRVFLEIRENEIYYQ